MNLVIFLLKAILIIQYVMFIKIYYEAKKQDSSIHVSFGFVSLFEFFCVLTFSLAFILTIVMDIYGMYVLIIGILLNIYVNFMLKRVVVLGDQFMIIQKERVRIREIKGVDINFYSVCVKMKRRNLKVIYPIINYRVLNKELYERVGN